MITAANLKNPSSRAKLKIRTKPFFVGLGAGVSIGYGRNLGCGSWVSRKFDGKGKPKVVRFAKADDHAEANGIDILSWQQALERLSATTERSDDATPAKLNVAITVDEALTEYEIDLAHRGGLVAQVARARNVLGETLLSRPVAALTFRELRTWRDNELKRLSAGSVTRTSKTIKAALNYISAQPDYGIRSNLAWVGGLRALPDSNVPRRGMLLTDDQVREIVDACRAYDKQLGLLIEVLATAGCRASQAARLIVSDLKSNGVTLPRSMKGKGKKRLDRVGFPLPAALLARLREAADGRPGTEPLLQRSNGAAWTSGALRHPWRAALAKANLPVTTLPYSLRYSSIVRALNGGLEAAVVARSRDTSIRVMEQCYSADIDQVASAEVLGSLITL